MKQSRCMSLAEAAANVAVGYGVAVLGQVAVFPLFGIGVTLPQNMAIGGIFTVISIARTYALRRLFEALRGASRFGERAGHAGPEPSRPER